MPASRWIAIGGFLAALGVGLGAIGAHALKAHLTPERLATFHTAVHYQMIHAIGLILVGLLGVRLRSRWLDAAGWTMLASIAMFSGCLYAWVATDIRFFVHVVPIGGTAFIVGWILMAVGALRD